MPYKSKAQARFAFGTGQPWADKWAKHTPDMKSLPEKKGKGKPPVPKKKKKKRQGPPVPF